MNLHVILPRPQSAAEPPAVVCPQPACAGAAVRLHQHTTRIIKDVVLHHVPVHRYKCLGCGRTFRVYPAGVTHAHTTERVLLIAVLLYRLGLGCGAVSAALNAFGVYLSRTAVYDTVQTAQQRCPELVRDRVFTAVRPFAGRAVLVKRGATWLPLALVPDDALRLVVTVTALSHAAVAELEHAVRPVLNAMGAYSLRVDETDGLGAAADARPT